MGLPFLHGSERQKVEASRSVLVFVVDKGNNIANLLQSGGIGQELPSSKMVLCLHIGQLLIESALRSQIFRSGLTLWDLEVGSFLELLS